MTNRYQIRNRTNPLQGVIRNLLTLLFVAFTHMGWGQNGKIITKQLVDLTQTPAWSKVAQNDTLLSNYKHLEQLNFFSITYQSDGFTVRGIIVEPKKEGKYPVVIFNRGGNRDFARLTVYTMMLYTAQLAAEGYVVIGSNYRRQDEFGGADIQDVLILTETVKELEKADPNRIGMFGWSRGGMMTYLALKQSDRIKTAVVGNGPSDLFGVIADRPGLETKVLAECIPNYWANKTAELEKRSVMYWPEKLNPNSSLLILCGTKDRRVNPKQAENLAQKLDAIGYDYVLKKYPTDHFFTDHKEELNTTIINWFDQRLKE